MCHRQNTYGPKVVFCLRHFTAIHYHHCARLLTGTEYIQMFVGYPVEVCLTCCLSYRLPFIFIIIYGVICVQLAHFSSWWLKGYIFSSCCYHHQIGSIHLSRCYHIFPWLCASDVCYIIFCHLLHTRFGRTGNLFSLLLCSLWWVQIFGYVLACRSYSFVCTVHHLIMIILQTYLRAFNL